MPWGLVAIAIGQRSAFGMSDQTGASVPMETVGWGFQVKASELAVTLGQADTPVFPLEPVQPQRL